MGNLISYQPPPGGVVCNHWEVDMAEPQAITAVILWPLAGAYLIGMVLLLVNRNTRVIEARSPLNLIVSNLLSLLLHICMCFKLLLPTTWPCLFHLYDSSLLVNAICHLYLARMWWLATRNWNTERKNATSRRTRAAQGLAPVPLVTSRALRARLKKRRASGGAGLLGTDEQHTMPGAPAGGSPPLPGILAIDGPGGFGSSHHHHHHHHPSGAGNMIPLRPMSTGTHPGSPDVGSISTASSSGFSTPAGGSSPHQPPVIEAQEDDHLVKTADSDFGMLTDSTYPPGVGSTAAALGHKPPPSQQQQQQHRPESRLFFPTPGGMSLTGAGAGSSAGSQLDLEYGSIPAEQLVVVEQSDPDAVYFLGSFPEDPWYLRLRYRLMFASSRLIRAVLLGTFLVSILPTLLFTPRVMPDNAPRLHCDGCDLTLPFAVLIVEIAIYVALFIWFSTRFARMADDNFKIKLVFRWDAIIAGCGAVPWLVFSVAFKNWNNYVYRMSAVLPVLFLICLFGLDTVAPLVLSRRDERFLRSSRRNSGAIEQSVELLLLLSSEVGVHAFNQFLCREFAIENLIFWQVCNEFRDQCDAPGADPAQLYARAMAIHYSHIRAESDLQVNLTHEVVKEINSRLNEARKLAGRQEVSASVGTASPFGGATATTMATPTTSHDSLANLPPVPAAPPAPGDEAAPPGHGASHSMSQLHRSTTTMANAPAGAGAGDRPDPVLDPITARSIFTRAQKDIFTLMLQDSYPRFLQSSDFDDRCRAALNQLKANFTDGESSHGGAGPLGSSHYHRHGASMSVAAATGGGGGGGVAGGSSALATDRSSSMVSLPNIASGTVAGASPGGGGGGSHGSAGSSSSSSGGSGSTKRGAAAAPSGAESPPTGVGKIFQRMSRQRSAHFDEAPAAVPAAGPGQSPNSPALSDVLTDSASGGAVNTSTSGDVLLGTTDSSPF
ncbi:hypothetical protein H696_02638 [Fonticula alba]|uniref:RGS domain-containing protein n=1 Tax=Fonticula alba TaxID=691883 RepID=A0A058Z7N2_FONAL|nr:hypothetical protein H696_02638 [Fonticula alba]KCV70309.1 hypothetical protein H696_02638 [Fonticula alba]|eukprot:XP_009494825.1 hypothetical protein H696_02638 [Fonticula alba]